MDDKRSWVIAVACSWIAFCNTGIYRSSSVLYVEMIKVMAISRESASWPFSLFGAVSSFIGILPGLLSGRFSVRQFVVIGALISTTGVLACVLANDIAWITVSFGVITGFGSGLIMTLLPVVINENFKNNRATANGIFLSGATVSLLILPSLTEWLVHLFALKGTFLLLSGLVLNVLVGAMWLKSPPQEKTEVKYEPEVTEANYDSDSKTESSIISGFSEVNRRQDGQMNQDSRCIKSEISPFNKTEVRHETEAKTELKTMKIYNQSEAEQISINNHINSKRKSEVPKRQQDKPEVVIEKPEIKLPNYKYVQLSTNNLKNAKLSGRITTRTLIEAVVSWRKTLLDPMFILITFCSVTTRTVIVTVSLILVDYVMDKGETEIQGVILVSTVAIPELIGRLGSGWISDHKFLQRKHVFLISEAFSGVCLFLLTIVHSQFLIFTLCALFALTNGGAFILVNVFYLEYLGLDRLPVALGLKNLFTGLASLTRPWFIGIFRDQICSYDKLFQVLGVVSILAGFVWFLEPILKKHSKPNLTSDSED